MLELVMSSFRESVDVKLAFVEVYAEKVLEVGKVIAEALKTGNKLLLFGNGGSAADAQHIAAELVGRFERERKGLPAIALTTDSSALTALSNDYGFETVFERQVEALCIPGDVVIGITTSGNSPNVIRGLAKAYNMGATTVAFAGKEGGKVVEIAHYSFVVPSYSTARVQECHITLGHVLCEIIERFL
ncbi:MAG: D-sedoheptulose 7-phosphate isomerase [Aquificaceae bacterium]